MLEVRELRKEFQPLSGQPVVALGSVSFRVESGQFVSIVGPSGCGKSTLLLCIAGLSRPSAGRVLLPRREVSPPPRPPPPPPPPQGRGLPPPRPGSPCCPAARPGPGGRWG